MTVYTSAFGGQTLPPSEYRFRAFNLTADVTLYWPDNTDGTDLVASLMNVTPSGGVWTITLPPANEVSTARDFLIRNLGAVSMNVVDNAAGALATIAAGESRYFYITSNATAAGTWSVFTYGTGSSAADASALAGYGLTVLSGTLNGDLPITAYGAGITVAAADRAAFLLYQGGTTTWYLPDPTTLPNGFFCAVNNAGTGTLTIDANTAGGLIDESNTKTLQPAESCFIVSKGDATGYFTIGYGRSTEFAFTQLAVDISSYVTPTDTVTITSAQATNKLWYFYNTADADKTINIPAVASVYFVRVGAIGAGKDLTITTGSGSSVILTANQSYTIYCDGTNVVSAQTVAVTSTVALDDGSAAAPSLNFSLDTDTGLYRSTTNVLGIAANGTMVATFGTVGLTLATALSIANGGTGATSAAAARTALGLAIGTNVQAWDADLDAIAALAKTDGNFIVGDGATWVAESGATARASLGLTIGTNVQAWDADLDGIAAVASTGLLSRTGAGTAAARTITQPAAGITVTDGDGVLGNPTLALADDLAAIEALAVTGAIARTGASSWAKASSVHIGAQTYAADTGAADAYVITLDPVPSAYTEGMLVSFKASATNTGASTINVNGLGAKSIKNPDGSALAASVVVSGGIYDLRYDGSQFLLTRGPTGATGATGPVGPDGRTWFSGSGAPSDLVGVNGDFYMDTTNNYYYGPKAGGTWVGTGPVDLNGQSTNRTVTTATATASQTTFNVTYDVGVNLLDVFQNGVRLLASDYTATNGTTVVLNTGATAGDELTFVAWGYFSVGTPVIDYSVSSQTAMGAASGEVFNITYAVGYIEVYQNGVRLIPTTGFTASNGTSVTMVGKTTANDEIMFVTFTPMAVADALAPSDISVTVAPATSGTSMLKGNGSGGFSNGSDGTDFLSPSTGCKQGKQTIWVPAAGMTPRTTNGAASGLVETTTNKVMLKSMDFADGANALYAQFTVRMPKSWNQGTVTASFVWTANSTSTNSVVWGIQGLALSDADSIDVAFGTAQEVTDANTATAYQTHISDETSAVTIGGSPASMDWVVFQVYRDPTNGSDNLAATAILLGIHLYYVTSAANDA